jgi:TRAP-type transport system small permease protein
VLRLAMLVQRVSRVTNWAGVFCLIPLMLTTTIDVVLRYFFNRPIRGGLEISQLIMLVVIWLGMAMTTQKKGHIAMQLLESRLSKKTLYYSDMMIRAVMIITMFLLNWAVFRRMVDSYAEMETTDVLHFPLYPALLVMLIGGILVVLELIAELILMKIGGEESGKATESADLARQE